jgi:hypothetical protein
MRTYLLIALFVLTGVQARAQDVSVGSVLRSTVLDPTTYAPAVIYHAGLRSDWNTSRPLFNLGYVEINPEFTQSGKAWDTPLSHADGHAYINRLALRLLVDSAVHNVASHSVERLLIRKYPHKRKALKWLGIAERVAVASVLTSLNATKHFRQAELNRATYALHRRAQ